MILNYFAFFKKKKIVFHCIFLVSVFSSIGQNFASDSDFFADYSRRNTLPDLCFTTDNGVGKLTKVTLQNSDYLELLDLRLQKNGQYQPGFEKQDCINLFKGNEDSKGYRGWIITLSQENTQIPVGFIGYSLKITSYYDQKFPDRNVCLSSLEGKVCFEVEWYVEPKFQRQGLASAAFESIMDYIEKDKMENIHIDCFMARIPQNNRLSKFFARKHQFKFLGLDAVGQEMWVRPILYIESESK